jgi:hypothetical protein
MKTAVRLAQCVPTAGAPRRSYTPGGPLFAMRPLKFQGVQFSKGDVLPVAQMTKERHRRLWVSGLASHAVRGPFDRKPKAKPAPAVVDFDVSDAAPVSTVTVLHVSPDEIVSVETPAQRDQRRSSKPKR